MIKLKINNDTHYIPTTGKELSMKQYDALRLWALQDDAQEYDLVSALAGIMQDEAIESAHIWANRIDIASMADLFKYAELPEPKTVKVNGQELRPQSMAMLKVSQRMLLKQVFDKVAEGEALEPHLPRVLAIGFGEQMYGKGWTANVSMATKIFEEQPAHEFLPVAYFFLRSALYMKSNGKVSFSLLMRHGLMQVASRCKGLAYGQ